MTKKKILIITDTFPYPVSRNGFTENISNLLVNLNLYYSKEFYIALLFIGDLTKITNEGISYVKTVVNELHLKQLKNSKLIRLSKLLFRKNLGVENNYDLLFFGTFLSAYSRFNFPKSAKTILYQADSRTLFWSYKKGLLNKLKYLKYKIEQKILFKYFTKVIFVSEIDSYEVNKYTNLGEKSIIIPIGVNIPKLTNDNVIKKEIDCIFTGNFHFKPNSDAAIFFMNEICSLLILKEPQIKIAFVGRFPTSEMENIARKYPKNIVITGEVPTISEYLQKSKIYFSPVYWGSGMKNKILQAMSHAMPIVCTIESSAGVENKNLFLIPKNTDDWVSFLSLLINNEELRTKYGERNFIEVKSRYTFENITKNHFVTLFQELISD